MSDVSVDIIKNRNGEAPDLPSGANLSGVSTAATLQVTNLNPTHINASGVTTATTFSGSFKSTSTPTLGLGVTINSSGINISGVATAGIVSATTLYGDGSNLTGVAMSIAPITYNPDIGDSSVGLQPGIGITFTERIKAGSGNITLSVATNAGAAGTFVEAFGVGSSVTINNNTLTFTPTSNLTALDTYHVGIPAGAVTNTSGDVSLVATNWTFQARAYNYQMWVWGANFYGILGQNSAHPAGNVSSPIQIPSTSWSKIHLGYPNGSGETLASKDDGTLWAWGNNPQGQLGQNNVVQYSSPVQVGSDTTWDTAKINNSGNSYVLATKTDGTLWAWGKNSSGALGQNQAEAQLGGTSSPVQIGSGTDWATGRFKISNVHPSGGAAIKTDGTLYMWGYNSVGSLGQNQANAQLPRVSSPVQVPGTTWRSIGGGSVVLATKTDGTLWAWSGSWSGSLGLNEGGPGTYRSSPTQIPGTTWANVGGGTNSTVATKTDGTMWVWGVNDKGNLGQNNRTKYSSPTQIPGTNWDTENFTVGENNGFALKTDGTLWSWGYGYYGEIGINQAGDASSRSSPVQIPGTDWGWVTSNSKALKAL